MYMTLHALSVCISVWMSGDNFKSWILPSSLFKTVSLVLCARLACLLGIFLFPLPVFTLGVTWIRDTCYCTQLLYRFWGFECMTSQLCGNCFTYWIILPAPIGKNLKLKFAKIILLSPYCLPSEHGLCFHEMRMFV